MDEDIGGHARADDASRPDSIGAVTTRSLQILRCQITKDLQNWMRMLGG